MGDFSAHSLRSGFVTEAGRRRMDTADAMAMTGHRNYETFMGYYRARDPWAADPAFTSSFCLTAFLLPQT